MAANTERIPVIYTFDPASKEIHRKKGDGENVLEDKLVATYDPESQIVTFPNKNTLRLYKTGVITFLAENELLIRSFQLGDMKPDEPLNAKKIPPRPKKTNHEGDKTPAVVEWYFKYRWNEFCARYGFLGKYTGVVEFLDPLWEERPGGDGVKEYKGQIRRRREVVDVPVTTRKTHVSFLPEECVGDEAKGIAPWDEEDPEAGQGDAAAGISVRGGGDE